MDWSSRVKFNSECVTGFANNLSSIRAQIHDEA